MERWWRESGGRGLLVERWGWRAGGGSEKVREEEQW